MNLSNFLPIVLAIVAVLGDKTLELTSKDLYRALVDSLSHGLIGLISWLIIVLKSYKYKTYFINPYCDVIVSWIIASAIDIDHFILAKSFKLKNAIHLGEKRPVLHCTTIPVALLLITNISNWLWKLPRIASFGWISWVAIFSHHVRDGYRRGLWFWPIGSTTPIPYYVYIIITMLIPHSTFIMMLNFQVFNQHHKYSNVSVV